MTIQALRERRQALARDARNALDQTPAASWNDTAQASYDGIMDELNRVDAAISREQQLLDVQGEETAVMAVVDRMGGNTSHADALRTFARGGLSALSAEQLREMSARQNSDIRAAMSTTTAAEGGYTVSPEYVKRLEEALKAWSSVRNVANVIRTGTGAQMNFPTADATAEVGEIVGQNAAVTLGETSFGNATLDVYKYSSKKIALPFELLQDSFIDIEGYILDLLARRVGRIQNQHFTTGTNSGQPKGVVTAATLGKAGLTGQTATVIYDDLIDLEHSVDPAYRAACKYMMNDASVKVLRKCKDAQGRPIFVPGYEVGSPGGAPDTLLGRQIVINQDMAVMAANAKSILFGDFSKYIIRDVMDLTLFRMTDSAFTLNGQVGFVGFQRTGANLIDVGGCLKYYANSAT